ncbi:prorelaxin-like [Tachyglossus aculeatus]|uniref:prorelaxin-like n=1 Tax=Tachyglossus aculeatus TaxID=9261 RepID=UPI0018F70175|nr:prorelaxin-like [Tachyglossus aculeatus]
MQYPVFSQLLWVWLLSSHFPGEGRSQQPERMKLCGREFIRTVIYTCGSSRWRRLSLDQQMDRQAQPAESVQSFISKDVEPDKLKSALNPGVEELQGIFTQKKLKDLFDLDSDHESLPMSENLKTYIDQLKEYSETSQGEGEATNPLEPSNFSWVKHPRKKRDFSLASYCCTYTCTKADIAKAC